jgi:hypothetical protein
MKLFDRSRLRMHPLSDRENKLDIRKLVVRPKEYTLEHSLERDERIVKVAEDMVRARAKGKPVIVAFGAHLIKNGLGFTLSELVSRGCVTHLATNGAGSIHDWEFAYQGKSGEDVRERVFNGTFGMSDETGKFINLAVRDGALNNLGYGESIGKMIFLENVALPDGDTEIVRHPYRAYSLQYHAFQHGALFTVHPGYGYDITHTHPLVNGDSIGRASERDFLGFAESVSNLEGGGVYLSIGSAIMSPMIFEKSLSMSRNVALQNGKNITDFSIVVNDIIDSGNWNFGSGDEPSQDDPAYYNRLCKSFDRMGADRMSYIQMDNRDFLVGLYYELERVMLKK